MKNFEARRALRENINIDIGMIDEMEAISDTFYVIPDELPKSESESGLIKAMIRFLMPFDSEAEVNFRLDDSYGGKGEFCGRVTMVEGGHCRFLVREDGFKAEFYDRYGKYVRWTKNLDVVGEMIDGLDHPSW